MQIIQVEINQLRPSEYNPRKWDDDAIKNLTESIQHFGIVDPIIVNEAENRKNIVIGGHFRLKVAKDLGFKTVPCVFINIPDETKERELNLRLNKNLGAFDYKALAEFDQDLLAAVGFSSHELEQIFEINTKEDDFDQDGALAGKTSPIANLGEVFVLGSHRLMCGDSTKAKDVAKLMDGQKARLIFTDPPYNVDYTPTGDLDYDPKMHTRGYGDGKIFNDNKTDEECLEFYIKVLNNIYESSTDDATLYWWFANKNNRINREAFESAKWHMSQVIIWLKNSMVYSRGQDYHRVYEPCMVGWKKGKPHYRNKEIHTFQDVFNLDKKDFEEILDVWFEHRDNTMEYIHPTQKPVRRAERALRKNSEQGDIVLDLFGGSGSTLIACEQMNRRCFMMELDPKFVDSIITRWEKLTGLKAQKL